MANSLEKSILVIRYEIHYTLAKNNKISCKIFIRLPILSLEGIKATAYQCTVPESSQLSLGQHQKITAYLQT